ncbi:MAG: hypothetical protein GY860_12990 [Desulfobacteraceae bacterium]|nr:hypothetical protein [Desulfobacteraceae bacterium]
MDIKLLNMELPGMGGETLAKKDVVMAIEALKTGKYNLILLDIDLPGSLDMVQIIRQYEKEEKK